MFFLFGTNVDKIKDKVPYFLIVFFLIQFLVPVLTVSVSVYLQLSLSIFVHSLAPFVCPSQHFPFYLCPFSSSACLSHTHAFFLYYVICALSDSVDLSLSYSRLPSTSYFLPPYLNLSSPSLPLSLSLSLSLSVSLSDCLSLFLSLSLSLSLSF